ncbi:MAG TPA: hypothetical protein VGB83_02925 [Actinomycetota bacterium]
MARPRRWLAGALLLLGLTAAGCTDPPFIELPNPIEGQITQIGTDDLVLETGQGKRYTFIIADEEVTIAHLREHLAGKLPVLISWRRDGYALVATRIADA